MTGMVWYDITPHAQLLRFDIYIVNINNLLGRLRRFLLAPSAQSAGFVIVIVGAPNPVPGLVSIISMNSLILKLMKGL